MTFSTRYFRVNHLRNDIVDDERTGSDEGEKNTPTEYHLS